MLVALSVLMLGFLMLGFLGLLARLGFPAYSKAVFLLADCQDAAVIGTDCGDRMEAFERNCRLEGGAGGTGDGFLLLDSDRVGVAGALVTVHNGDLQCFGRDGAIGAVKGGMGHIKRTDDFARFHF